MFRIVPFGVFDVPKMRAIGDGACDQPLEGFLSSLTVPQSDLRDRCLKLGLKLRGVQMRPRDEGSVLLRTSRILNNGTQFWRGAIDSCK